MCTLPKENDDDAPHAGEHPAVAAALALTACGGDSGTGTEAAAGGTAAGDAAFPRTVEHAMGSTEIPEEPERVVVLDTGELDSALALGVTPVGAVTTDVSAEFVSYLAEDAEGIDVVGGPIRAYQPESFIGTVLADIGLDLVELPGGEGATFAQLSEEQLTQANGDVVLYSSYGSADESGEAAVVAGPLWSRLPAVQNGRAYAVDDDVFYTGIGLKAATLQLEQLEELLVG